MVRIDLDLRCSGELVDKENVLEGLAAIRRSIEAALLIRPIGMSGHGNEDAVRIMRVNGDLADLLSIAKTEVRP
jgi:pyridoxal biosynthesis lyase PdxS